MINLLPPKRLLDLKIARGNTVLRRYIELVVFSMAVLALVILGSFYYLKRQQQNTKQTVSLNQQKIKELEPVQKEAQNISATVNTISSLLSRDVKFSEMLTQLGSLTPQGAVLTGLQFSIEDLKSPLIISAQVDNEQKAAILRNNLAGSPLFSKAEIQSITTVGATSTTENPGVPSNQPPVSSGAPKLDSPYKFTTIINAYFKDIAATGSKTP